MDCNTRSWCSRHVLIDNENADKSHVSLEFHSRFHGTQLTLHSIRSSGFDARHHSAQQLRRLLTLPQQRDNSLDSFRENTECSNAICHATIMLHTSLHGTSLRNKFASTRLPHTKIMYHTISARHVAEPTHVE